MTRLTLEAIERALLCGVFVSQQSQATGVYRPATTRHHTGQQRSWLTRTNTALA